MEITKRLLTVARQINTLVREFHKNIIIFLRRTPFEKLTNKNEGAIINRNGEVSYAFYEDT